MTVNKGRRAEIAKAQALVAEALEILSAARDGEQEAYDNMPESLQNSERGERVQAAIDALESACSSCEEIDGYCDEAAE